MRGSFPMSPFCISEKEHPSTPHQRTSVYQSILSQVADENRNHGREKWRFPQNNSFWIRCIHLRLRNKILSMTNFRDFEQKNMHCDFVLFILLRKWQLEHQEFKKWTFHLKIMCLHVNNSKDCYPYPIIQLTFTCLIGISCFYYD